METLVKTGKVRRGMLGITVQKVTSEVVEKLKLKAQRGILVAQVQPGSGADKAGIRQGDIITAINGTEVNEPNVFRNIVAGTAPGTEVTLTIQRDGREQQVRATLGEFSQQAPSQQER